MQLDKNSKNTNTKKEHVKRTVIQIRMIPSELQRMLDAMALTPFHNRCEFVRILLDEALKNRGL